MKTALIRIFLILIVFISISWYGKLDHILEKTEEQQFEHNISYNEANSILVKPVYRTKQYFYKYVVVRTYSRTLIPFKYEKGETITKKQYYHKE